MTKAVQKKSQLFQPSQSFVTALEMKRKKKG